MKASPGENYEQIMRDLSSSLTKSAGSKESFIAMSSGTY